MSDRNSINKSFDAFRSLRRDIDALTYLANLIPEDDEHQSLIFILADRLDQNAIWLHNQLCPLWAEIASKDKRNDAESEAQGRKDS